MLIPPVSLRGVVLSLAVTYLSGFDRCGRVLDLTTARYHYG
jgi:hypothetical protein